MKSPLQEVRDNPRLRIGLVLIVAIVWGYGILELRDRAAASADSANAQARRVLRLQQQSAQAQWLDAEKVSSARRVEAEKTVWVSDTTGSASASLQDWLQDESKKSGLARAQITLSDGAELGPLGLAGAGDRNDRTPSSVKKIRGRLGFDFDSAAFQRFMVAVTGGPHPIHIDSMTIRNTNPGRADIQFYALARIVPKTDTTAAAGAQPPVAR